MTNDQLGAFVDWVAKEGWQMVEVHELLFPIGDKNWMAKIHRAKRGQAANEMASARGTSAREAIAALAEQVMPKPQCCGECWHWQRPEAQPYPVGDCTAPIPHCLTASHQVRTRIEEGEKCPCFQRRPE